MARLPKTYYNPVSLIGTGLALVTLLTILVFFFVDTFGAFSSPYLGIFTYMILPGVMVFGLMSIPAGMWLESRRLKRAGGAPRAYLRIDLNLSSHRFAFMIFTVGTMFLVILSAAGTYQAYTYSESVEFCGEVCHTVMKPEFIAYQHSPHARVLCAECHIGEGADWFVKAKISGLYQVYSVTFGKYSRPIETPIRNLRPARETCEHCHWPQKFSASLEMAKTYFPLDTAAVRPWSITLQLKIGGGQSELGATNGIHWHMNTANKIEYVATDDKRQTIPLVKSTNVLTGKVRFFKSIDGYDERLVAKGEHRVMDCIDCHNRPAHIYHPPFRTVNDAMALNRIPNTLPNIRSIASFALTREYESEKQAETGVPHTILAEYETRFPDLARTRRADIEKAMQEVSRIYTRNFFPEMNVSWRNYPNNIGHMYNDGCFRCHDNRHAAEDGSVISNDCRICHLILAQGPTGSMRYDLNGMDFTHPTDIGNSWREDKCVSCHNGE